jgi:hypothetical protein
MPLWEEWRIESGAMSHGSDSPESSRCVVLQAMLCDANDEGRLDEMK